jgi:hypothetical protein
MDITIDLPEDPQRLLTAMRVIHRRQRVNTLSFAVTMMVLGVALIAAVIMIDADGLHVLPGLFLVIWGAAMFRQYDRALAKAVADRPAYTRDGRTVRLTDDELSVLYPQASLRIAWPMVSKVDNTAGHWLFFSGPAAILSLQVTSLQPAQAEELRAFLAGRGLVRSG